MSVSTFSDRYAGGNAGTAVTIPAAGTGYVPSVLGISGSGTSTLLRVYFQVTTPTATPAANDLWYLGPLLLGYTLGGYYIDFPAMDSSTGLQIELGDITTAGKYIATGTAAGNSSAASYFISGTSTTVHASLPNFYTAYPTSGSRSQPGATNSANFSIGVANDLIIKVTQAPSGTYTAGAIGGFYDLVQIPYPYGTRSQNY